MGYDIQNLVGKLLLSTSLASGVYLEKSIIYICSHGKNGAIGVIINKKIPNASLCNIFRNSLLSPDEIQKLNIHFGGMEDIDKCFMFHTCDNMFVESVLIDRGIALTSNVDIFKIITSIDKGPEKKLICMGCCVWEPEQLEDEVAYGAWIPITADEALVFGDDRADKWSKAFLKIGSSTNVISYPVGNA